MLLRARLRNDLSEAVKLVTSRLLSDELQPDALTFLATLFRQSLIAYNHTSSTQAHPLVVLFYQTLGPALLPGGVAATLIIANLEGASKVQQIRAKEALESAGRLAEALPPPEASGSTPNNLLTPLLYLGCVGVFTAPHTHVVPGP